MSGEDNGPERMLHVEDSVAACPLLRIGMRGVFLDHLAGAPPGSYDHLRYGTNHGLPAMFQVRLGLARQSIGGGQMSARLPVERAAAAGERK